jgi:hypothetical protein
VDCERPAFSTAESCVQALVHWACKYLQKKFELVFFLFPFFLGNETRVS